MFKVVTKNLLALDDKRPPSYSSKINRWTGKPHEHKREIARNLRHVCKAAIQEGVEDHG